MKRQVVDTLFPIALAITQIVVVVFYGIYQKTIYNETTLGENVNENLFRYPLFQDVHIMIYVGFGFLLTFIHRYRLSCLTMCFWVAAIFFQFYFLFAALWKGAFHAWEDIYITPERLILGEVASASVLIVVCAIIGKANNLQYLIITVSCAFLYTLNEEIVIAVLGVRDVGGSMIIHAFGAFFGIGVTIMLNYKPSMYNKNLSATQTSFTTAMIGTLFLWCFWPSFNAALAVTPSDIHLSVLNTYFSIIGSIVSTYFTTTILEKGKFHMDHVLNASLAGGVCMGSGADLLYGSYAAYIVGLLTGIVSTLLFEFMPRLLRRYDIWDIAGVLNLHGIPGMLGGLYSAAFRAVYIDGRGGIQVAGTFISIGIGLAGGLVVGFVVRGFNFFYVENQFFNDLETVALDDEVREKLELYEPLALRNKLMDSPTKPYLATEAGETHENYFPARRDMQPGADDVERRVISEADEIKYEGDA